MLLSGAASLTTRDVARNTDDVHMYRPHQLVTIPPRVPHLFEFHEDSYLLEWWDCPFEAW